MDPSGEFAAYAKPVDEKHAARIQQRPDDSKAYTRPEAEVTEQDGRTVVRCGDTSVIFDNGTAKMQVRVKDRIVLEEAEEKFAGAVLRLLQDEVLYKSYRDKAPARAGDFSTENYMEGLLSCMEKM